MPRPATFRCVGGIRACDDHATADPARHHCTSVGLRATGENASARAGNKSTFVRIADHPTGASNNAQDVVTRNGVHISKPIPGKRHVAFHTSSPRCRHLTLASLAVPILGSIPRPFSFRFEAEVKCDQASAVQGDQALRCIRLRYRTRVRR